MTPGGTSAPSTARAGTGSHRKEPALCWVTPSMLKGPQTLLYHLCWLTPPWVALPDQRVLTCLLSKSIPSHPISFFTLLVPQLLPGLGSACLLLQGCDSSQAVCRSQVMLGSYGSLHYFNVKSVLN